MFKFMTKKAFDAAIGFAVEKATEKLAFTAETRKQNNEGLRKLLNAAIGNLHDAKDVIQEQAAQIKEMAPFADLGRRRKLAEDKRNAKMKAKRAAK